MLFNKPFVDTNYIETYAGHDIAEILLKLVLNTNQSINQSINGNPTSELSDIL